MRKGWIPGWFGPVSAVLTAPGTWRLSDASCWMREQVKCRIAALARAHVSDRRDRIIPAPKIRLIGSARAVLLCSLPVRLGAGTAPVPDY
jgi:hypothetical protein